MRKFAETYNLRRSMGGSSCCKYCSSVQEYRGGKINQTPQIAIVDLKGMPTMKEFELFKEFFEQQGYRSIICSPDELEFSGNACVAATLKSTLFTSAYW